MLRHLWVLLFGGCVHSFKWERFAYTNMLVQRGTCTKCNYTKERNITGLSDPNLDCYR